MLNPTDNGKVKDEASYIDEKGHGTIVLLQYTGIKNMDNVEICEGDILRLPNGKKRTVLKVPGGFAIESLDCDYGKYGKRVCVPIDGLSDEQNANFVAQCKVIGNIYENPELL
jgi:uncharacterized phage protein (TIGR01671 family)